MLADPKVKKLWESVKHNLHSGYREEAALAVAEWGKVKIGDSKNPARQNAVLHTFLHFLLANDAIIEAGQMLWTDNMFSIGPQSAKEVWNLFDTCNFGLIMGAASMWKSYTMGVRLMLEWIRDPEWTTVTVVGPSEKHLEKNLFSHLVGLHSRASLPMPGEVGELFIGLSRRNQVGGIRGEVIPIGSRKKAGRIQGNKRVNRPHAHPIFGKQSRMFCFIDEIENVPGGIWSDIGNVMSNLDEPGTPGLRIIGSYNPTDMSDEVAKQAEPPFGWENFDVDTHFKWVSQRGWSVLRLDGEKSENVVQNKIVYPGLQSRAGLEQIAKKSGGRNSPGYMAMGRGAYPSQGVELVIIPPGLWPKFRGEFIWYDKPINIAGCDLALEGGAAAVYTLGLFGLATGIKYPASIEHPNGRTVMFKNRMGQVIPRYGAQANQQFILPKGETVAMKNSVIALCRKAGVRGPHICLDRTGHTAGVCDLMKHEWDAGIIDVNYSEAASEMKIMAEDKNTAKEEYTRIDSELWFAMKLWGEFGYLLISPQMDITELTPQVTGRRYKTVNGRTKVESKRDYMSRMPGNTAQSSPDHADSLGLFVNAARKFSKFVPSMMGDNVSPGEGDPNDWPFSGGVRIDPSNMSDTLAGEFSPEHAL
jgi:hypothetical protein